MLLTPKFSIQQTDTEVFVTIMVPHIRVGSAEILVDDSEFSFYCKPYLLKLTFPKSLRDDEESYSATYDPNQENGTLVVKLLKRNPGEVFPDLDLLSKLMQVRKVETLGNSMNDYGEIEVIHSENFVDTVDEPIEEPVENSSANSTLPPLIIKDIPYGFNSQYNTILRNLREFMIDMISISNPEKLTPLQRRQYRLLSENETFDPYRYLGDYFGSSEDMYYQSSMNYQPFWNVQYDEYIKLKKTAPLPVPVASNDPSNPLPSTLNDEGEDPRAILSFQAIGGFTETELSTLRDSIKYKEYLFSLQSQETKNLLCNLVDILFAYCYDYRLTEGDFNVESPTNIAKLSATLSCLEKYAASIPRLDTPTTTTNSECKDTLLHVIAYSMRRMLCHGFLRVWKLGRKVLGDVTKILLIGKRTILKIFLSLYTLFEHTDTHYLLNKLYIHDFCVWIQQVPSSLFYQLGVEYNSMKMQFEKQEKVSKESMGFALPELETWALETNLEEESDSREAIPTTITNYTQYISDHVSTSCAYLQCCVSVTREDLYDTLKIKQQEEEESKEFVKAWVEAQQSQQQQQQEGESGMEANDGQEALPAQYSMEEEQDDSLLASLNNPGKQRDIGLSEVSTVRKVRDTSASAVLPTPPPSQGKRRVLIEEISSSMIIDDNSNNNNNST
jgi:protein SHQ1